MSSDAKATRLNKLNVEKLYELNFNKTLSSLTPFEFADQVISKGLGLRHLVVGEDFCFGKGRSGTVKDLISLGNSICLLYTSPSPRDKRQSRMPSSA